MFFRKPDDQDCGLEGLCDHENETETCPFGKSGEKCSEGKSPVAHCLLYKN